MNVKGIPCLGYVRFGAQSNQIRHTVWAFGWNSFEAQGYSWRKCSICFSNLSLRRYFLGFESISDSSERQRSSTEISQETGVSSSCCRCELTIRLQYFLLNIFAAASRCKGSTGATSLSEWESGGSYAWSVLCGRCFAQSGIFIWNSIHIH